MKSFPTGSVFPPLPQGGNIQTELQREVLKLKKEKDAIRLSIVCYLRKKVWMNTKNKTRRFYEKHTKTMKNMRTVKKSE